jgi:DNA-binding winged helix-turn-helix (wHTH) protein/Tol biopolymer transport system component
METVADNQIYVFGDFSLDPKRRLLLHDGEGVLLHPKAFDLLCYLVENRDRVLSKNELLNAVWAGQFVEENNLAVQIFALRKIFGERKDEHHFIVTVPGKGYRFVAEVQTENPAAVFITNNFAGNGFIASPKKSAPAAAESAPLVSRIERQYFLWSGGGLLLLLCLAAIFFWRGADKTVPKHPTLTKLTISGDISNATLTPDGHYAVYAQKEAGGESLWLKQIATGSRTRIVPPQKLEYVGLTVSPDNNFIYYSAFEANQADTFLRRIPLLGGAAEKVGSIETGVSVSFSPGGKQFVFTQAHSQVKENHLKIADADGANERVLLRARGETRALENFRATPAAWSPNENEIAVAVIEKTAGDRRAGILLVNATDGTEQVLLAPRFAWISNLAWNDAKNLAFVAGESKKGSSQIWLISRNNGEMRRVTNDLNQYQWLAAAGGRLLSVQQNSVTELRIAEFDENLKEFPMPRSLVRETNVSYAAFANDNSIIYTSSASGKSEIWRVATDGSNPAQLTTDAQITKGFAVSPADGSIVFSSARGDGKNSLWLADAEGKNIRRLTDGNDIFPQFSSDGKTIVFQRDTNDVPTVWRVPASGGAAVQLTTMHSLKPTVSPDGERTAFYFMDREADGAWRIGLVSTVTGELLGKLSFPTTVNERRMRWHPSGKFLAQILNQGETANLLLLPAGSGDWQTISNLGKGSINSFDWSRDSRQIVFTQTTETQDAVLLAGF